ncbi:MAG TPA: hypothetical protein VF459_03120 [Caulobacteraceae bacterium]
MLKPVLFLGLIGVSALALAACNPPHPRHGQNRDDEADNSSLRVITKLDCPDEQGDLTRKSAAADGRSCDYVGQDGAVVTLQLASLTNGDTGAVLDPLGKQLRAELPAISPTPPDATAAPHGDKSGRDTDNVDIDMPGVHIHADGDKASIDAGGWGHRGVKIDADDHGAEVHVEDRGGPGVHKVMILTADSPGPNGYKVVGYEARGPVGGPMVVASVKAKDSDEHDDLLRDVRDLLSLNVGG